MSVRWEDGPNSSLERLIKRRGVTQEAVAKAAGVSASQVNKWLSGVRAPRAHELASVLQFLGHGSADEILGLKPPAIDPEILRHAYDLAEMVKAADTRSTTVPAESSEPKSSKR